ncbi:MAG: cob(I)yrinic acid a,c-diamide adenosyltransferase [Megasphaera sp.]|jgi:cob(I)alamin adenosyltransferase|uniref:cob(I)yrinic acid a,c-diamide adenosyltransferase n=1 Tax=Megasphaera sueciensis TaxID=349094 RepID=UPI003D02409D|nr:cob(I)yrinic acid a,c-diamide adenosyltransferase [Megasphaera sp.]MCI1824095.1 cob(I)yrinic acid a,c-diamide adenosyltransferase [Megasphaera sp.]
METGLIHVYCGDGKGKTTAALGLAVRCAGRGGKILFVQFLKDRPTGELASLALIPGITVVRGTGNKKFTFQMTKAERKKAHDIQNSLFDTVLAQCHTRHLDMLVLDEILVACSTGLVDESKLLSFLRTKPAKLEVVLTGRGPSQAVIDAADYVSEICKRKHPYDRGQVARIGIEE